MVKPPTLLIIIADGEHARFVLPDAGNTLRTIGSLDSASAYLRSRDIGADQSGRAFEAARAPVTRAVRGMTCMRWRRRSSFGWSASRSTLRRVDELLAGAAAARAA